VARIIAHRLETLKGPHRLAYDLGRPRSTIYGVLRRAGVSRLSFIDRPTRTVVRYERARPGELLHVDVKKLGRIREGGGWRLHGREMGRTKEMRANPVGFDYLHVAVDDHSRMAFVQALADEKGPTCAGFLDDAVAFFASHGVRIERVLTDNAWNYRRSDDFRSVLERFGIAHRRTELPTPDQWQSREVQPHVARGVRLQGALHLERPTLRCARALGRFLQCGSTPHGNRWAHPAAASPSTTLTGITPR
jgi:hypothetical protein